MIAKSWVRCLTSVSNSSKAHQVAYATGRTLPEVYALWLERGAAGMTPEAAIAKLGGVRQAKPTPKAKNTKRKPVKKA